MKYNRLNRAERRQNQQELRNEAMHGEGIFVYQNNTKGELMLPKPTLGGVKKKIAIGEQFQGDNYFMRLVPSMLRLIRVIQPPPLKQLPITENKENIMQEEKLILDQPDRVTSEGTTEQVASTPKQNLNENKAKEKEVLLTEEPLSGVEIIL
jgi:hypothetical protein